MTYSDILWSRALICMWVRYQSRDELCILRAKWRFPTVETHWGEHICSRSLIDKASVKIDCRWRHRTSTRSSRAGHCVRLLLRHVRLQYDYEIPRGIHSDHVVSRGRRSQHWSYTPSNWFNSFYAILEVHLKDITPHRKMNERIFQARIFRIWALHRNALLEMVRELGPVNTPHNTTSRSQ